MTKVSIKRSAQRISHPFSDECLSVRKQEAPTAVSGSTRPTKCPSWGFCPGRKEDYVTNPPGSIPIVVPEGKKTEERTELVEQQVDQTMLELCVRGV